MQRSMLCMLRSSTKRCTPLVQTLRCFSARAREREVKLACDALTESLLETFGLCVFLLALFRSFSSSMITWYYFLLLNQMYHRIILELARGIQAGDAVWFERVVHQLRGVLLERQNDAALMEVAASAPSTSTFPLAERKMEVKEVKEDVLEEDPQQNGFFGGFVVCLVHFSSFWYSVFLEEVTLKSMCLGTTTAAKLYGSHTNSLGLTC